VSQGFSLGDKGGERKGLQPLEYAYLQRPTRLPVRQGYALRDLLQVRLKLIKNPMQ
jgi:hypothetical protein